MEDVFESHAVVDQDLGDVGQAADLFRHLVPTAGDESLHLAECNRQVGQGRVQIGPAVVHDAGQTGQPVLEHDDLFFAVAKCGHECLQVLDDVDDVAAAFGENACGAGQLS
jgi:hypothetical protein